MRPPGQGPNVMPSANGMVMTPNTAHPTGHREIYAWGGRAAADAATAAAVITSQSS